MVGTTRSRVSFFMNRFRKLGFITMPADSKVVASPQLTAQCGSTRLSIPTAIR